MYFCPWRGGSQTVEADFQHSEENYMYLKHLPGEKGDESIFFSLQDFKKDENVNTYR